MTSTTTPTAASTLATLEPFSKEIQSRIFNFLKLVIPAKLLRLNQATYDELLPKIYHTLSFHKQSDYENILSGLEGLWMKNIETMPEETVQLSKKKFQALKLVKSVYVGNLEMPRQRNDITRQVWEARGTDEFFPNLEHVHLDSKAYHRIPEVFEDDEGEEEPYLRVRSDPDEHGEWEYALDEIGQFFALHTPVRNVTLDYYTSKHLTVKAGDDILENGMTVCRALHENSRGDEEDPVNITVNIYLDGGPIPTLAAFDLHRSSEEPLDNFCIRFIKNKNSPDSGVVAGNTTGDSSSLNRVDETNETEVSRIAQAIWKHYQFAAKREGPWCNYEVEDSKSVLEKLSLLGEGWTPPAPRRRRAQTLTPIEDLVKPLTITNDRPCPCHDVLAPQNPGKGEHEGLKSRGKTIAGQSDDSAAEGDGEEEK